MQAIIDHEVRRILRWARQWGADLDELRELVDDALREEVRPTIPDDSGATLPGPHPHTLAEIWQAKEGLTESGGAGPEASA